MFNSVLGTRGIAAAGLLVLTLGACSSGTTTSTGDSSMSMAMTTQPSNSAAAPLSPSENADEGLVIPVRIEGANVTPSNATMDAKVGENITLKVDSDTDEEIHIHSVPEHHFDVQPVSGQVFTFRVDLPGQVAVELHHSDKTVVTLSVR